MKTAPAIALFLILPLLLTPPLGGEESTKEQLAVEAASAWLGEVDQGAYGPSWDHAAELFRQAIGRDQWIAALNGSRRPLGGVGEREVQSATYATELPGAPDGEYVVIQYETSFENKRHAIETVTPMLEPDGVWRVSGYYIQ